MKDVEMAETSKLTVNRVIQYTYTYFNYISG